MLVIDADWSGKLERPSRITVVSSNGSKAVPSPEALEAQTKRLQEVQDFFEDTVEVLPETLPEAQDAG